MMNRGPPIRDVHTLHIGAVPEDFLVSHLSTNHLVSVFPQHLSGTPFSFLFLFFFLSLTRAFKSSCQERRGRAEIYPLIGCRYRQIWVHNGSRRFLFFERFCRLSFYQLFFLTILPLSACTKLLHVLLLLMEEESSWSRKTVNTQTEVEGTKEL